MDRIARGADHDDPVRDGLVAARVNLMNFSSTTRRLMIVVAIVAIVLGAAIQVGEAYPVVYVFALFIGFGLICSRYSDRLRAVESGSDASDMRIRRAPAAGKSHWL